MNDAPATAVHTEKIGSVGEAAFRSVGKHSKYPKTRVPPTPAENCSRAIGMTCRSHDSVRHRPGDSLFRPNMSQSTYTSAERGEFPSPSGDEKSVGVVHGSSDSGWLLGWKSEMSGGDAGLDTVVVGVAVRSLHGDGPVRSGLIGCHLILRPSMAATAFQVARLCERKISSDGERYPGHSLPNLAQRRHPGLVRSH